MNDDAKKSDKLEVRLPHATKRAFLDRCRADGVSASEAVRGFIDTYLARPLTSKELPMYVRPTLAYAAAAAIAVIGITTLSASPSRAAPDFRGVFKSIDANGDGKITKDEMGKPSGSPAPAASEGKRTNSVSLSANFNDLDVNQDGSVVFAEFEAFALASVRKAFLQLDSNSDGKIILAEMRPTPQPAGGPSGYAVAGNAEAFFAKFDVNKDGAINEEEFANLPPH